MMQADPPEDLGGLCRDLGIGLRARARMLEKYGEPEVLMKLQKLWRKTVPERPRLLHRESGRGYTTQPALAMQGEPEAVSPGDQRRITAEAHAKEADVSALVTAQRQQLTLEKRLQGVRDEAALRRVDLSSDERVIESRLRAIKDKLAA
jgi:hypothetical protein